MSDWPTVIREVHLLGGGYAINSPDKRDKVFIFPHTLSNKNAVLAIEHFNYLYRDLRRLGLNPIGTEFTYFESQFDGSDLPEWRFNYSYKKNVWAHSDARQKWGEISNSAYDLQKGHLWDLSKRIQYAIDTLNNSFQYLSVIYRKQLNARVVCKQLKIGQRFQDAFSSLIYEQFQVFLFNACILRDYLSEFVFHYLIPDERKTDKHMTTTSKIYKKYYQGRTFKSEFDNYFKEICSDIGWLHKLGVYRDLVMHACPLSMPNKKAWIRLGSIDLKGGQEFPIIIAPIPKNPELIKLERNSFKFFKDFMNQAEMFFDQSNEKEDSIDLLEYSVEIMGQFSKLLWELIESSPVKGEMIHFGEHNIIGEIKISRK